MKLRKLLKTMNETTSIVIFDTEKGQSFRTYANPDYDNVSMYLDYEVTDIGNDTESIVITLRQSDNSQDIEEDKITFIMELGESLHKCADRVDIKKLRYVRDKHNEFVLITFENGLQKRVCVTGDSCVGIMNDIYKALR